MNLRSIYWVVLLVGLVALMLVPNAWATPAQNPERQTVPTRPHGTVVPPTSPPSSPQPTSAPPSPPSPPTSAPPQVPTVPPPVSSPTVANAPVAASATPLPAATQVATPISRSSSTAQPMVSPIVAATRTPLTPGASPVPTSTLLAQTEIQLPTLMPISESASSGASNNLGGVSPFLCGGGGLVLIGVIVLMFGKRRD
jgi:hypothetical protein